MANNINHDECSVCYERFTKQPTKRRAQCPYCPMRACIGCVQTYLTSSTDDPCCFECRRAWTREVIDSVCLTTWINGPFKLHRQQILLDRERSRLPAAQIHLENVKMGEARVPMREALAEEIHQAEMQLTRLRTAFYRESVIITQYLRGEDPLADGGTGAAAGGGGGAAAENTQDRRVFVMPCPADGCRGFLSSAYKCGLCDIYACPECREVKGHERDAAHTCNPDTVATVRALKKDCRPCPECGTNIFKIEGCDQMFCTNCNTPFSWASGRKITNGVIHNPHYFEYLRAMNGGAMPRNPGDIPCAGNLPNAWTFEREICRRFPEAEKHGVMDWLLQALRVVHHMQQVEIPRETNHAEDQNNMDVNIRYLRQDLTEVRWKQLLAQREKRRIKRDEVRMRYEAFVGACVDIYGRLMASARTAAPIDDANEWRRFIPVVTNKTSIAAVRQACIDARTQLEALANIYNEGMMQISKRYKCQVLCLTDKALRTEMRKWDSGRSRRVRRTDNDTVATEDTDEVAALEEAAAALDDDTAAAAASGAAGGGGATNNNARDFGDTEDDDESVVEVVEEDNTAAVPARNPIIRVRRT
jgi:hypothetical protein